MILIKINTEGYSFIAFGADSLFLGEMCRGELENLKNLIAKI